MSTRVGAGRVAHERAPLLDGDLVEAGEPRRPCHGRTSSERRRFGANATAIQGQRQESNGEGRRALAEGRRAAGRGRARRRRRRRPRRTGGRPRAPPRRAPRARRTAGGRWGRRRPARAPRAPGRTPPARSTKARASPCWMDGGRLLGDVAQAVKVELFGARARACRRARGARSCARSCRSRTPRGRAARGDSTARMRGAAVAELVARASRRGRAPRRRRRCRRPARGRGPRARPRKISARTGGCRGVLAASEGARAERRDHRGGARAEAELAACLVMERVDVDHGGRLGIGDGVAVDGDDDGRRAREHRVRAGEHELAGGDDLHAAPSVRTIRAPSPGLRLEDAQHARRRLHRGPRLGGVRGRRTSTFTWGPASMVEVRRRSPRSRRRAHRGDGLERTRRSSRRLPPPMARRVHRQRARLGQLAHALEVAREQRLAQAARAGAARGRARRAA